MAEGQKTPLWSWHKEQGARMCPFSGWDMPIQYKLGILKEHEFVRTHAGLFDVSHMGEFRITGSQAKDFLQHVCTNNLNKITNGGCQYTLLCYENGTVVDDLIINQISDTDFLLVVNAGNIQKDFDWMQKQAQNFDVTLENISDQMALIAIQGPKAQEFVGSVLQQDLSALKRFHHQSFDWAGQSVFVSRTGYTGEDGFEIMVPNEGALNLWNAFIEKGQDEIQAIGLGARDTLRLEACYSLYGHEINDQINAVEAGLSWVVDFEKDDFIGKDALVKVKAEGPHRKLIGFEMAEPGIARDGSQVMADGQEVGHVTSGSFLPTLKKAMGLALVKSSYIQSELAVDVRGKLKKIQKVKRPFYK